MLRLVQNYSRQKILGSMVIIVCISQINYNTERNFTLLLLQVTLAKFFREQNTSKKIRKMKDEFFIPIRDSI